MNINYILLFIIKFILFLILITNHPLYYILYILTNTNPSSHPPHPFLLRTPHLTEATNNFTLLDTKYKHDIQTMQTALTVQKNQYEQILSKMKSKHTTTSNVLHSCKTNYPFTKRRSTPLVELTVYDKDLQRVINESKEKDAIIDELKRKLQLMQMNSNNERKCSCVNDYKRKYEIVVEQNEKLQQSEDKLHEMAKQLVSTLQTTKEKYEMKLKNINTV